MRFKAFDIMANAASTRPVKRAVRFVRRLLIAMGLLVPTMYELYYPED